jgi:hypothetical protein
MWQVTEIRPDFFTINIKSPAIFNHAFNIILLDSTGVAGTEAYHHLTMGQPMQITLGRTILPTEVIVNISPLNQKNAGFARMCLKAINGDV